MSEPTNVLSAPLDAAALMRFLPHRPPFFFLRRLIEWSPGQRAVSEVEFDGSEEFFRGHFPGRPIVPGVILIEAAAQTAGLALAQEFGDAATAARGTPAAARAALPEMPAALAPSLAPWLVKVKEFRFRDPVRPRELLAIEALVTTRFGTSGAVAVTVRRGATRVADGELMVTLSPA